MPASSALPLQATKSRASEYGKALGAGQGARFGRGRLGRPPPRRVAVGVEPGRRLHGLPVECRAERFCAPAGRRPVGVLDDVDDVAGMLGGDRGWHVLADPVDQLHDVLEDV
jgi:hypothetical protein